MTLRLPAVIFGMIGYYDPRCDTGTEPDFKSGLIRLRIKTRQPIKVTG
jgi:hypothetical protein